MNAKLVSDLEARRRKLRMSKSLVARRAGVSLPTVNRILLGKEANPRIDNIAAVARALGVVVRLGSETEVEETQNAFEFKKARAVAKAKRLVGLVQGNMALEAQAVNSDAIQEMVEQTVCELMAGSSKRLWDD